MELSEKLTNVRRATRLLAAYNRRLLSILKLVHETAQSADKLALEFIRWQPMYHAPIGNQTTEPFARWGWDFLPLSFSGFRWTTNGKSKPSGPGSVMLGVWHEVDEAYEKSGGSEPDPVKFRAAEESSTLLYVWLLAIKSGTVTDEWSAVAEVVEKSLTLAAQMDGAVKDIPIDSLPGAATGAVVRFVGLAVPIEGIGSETAVETRLLAPLRKDFVDIFE